MSELMEKLKTLLKVLVVIGIVVLIGWGVKKGVNKLFQDATEDTTYPEDPATTATLFFTHLQNEEYQDCYGLLTPGRKSATVVGMQSRQNNGYFQHFRRIRAYLIERAGNDFVIAMVVSPDGQTVTFRDAVVLTISYDTTTSLDKKRHFPLNEINEFPIDAAPGIGIEQHNRAMNRAIESMGDIGKPEDQLDDPAEIIRQRPDEGPGQRLQRLIEAFKNARQLDTKHTVLDWILKEFPRDPATADFLYRLAQDEKAPPHLRRVAQNTLRRR
jgi:hypothetical protein